jgi:hypothetical protein
MKSVTELCCESQVLESGPGRRRVLQDLRGLCEAMKLETPPRFEDGWFLIPAEPAAVFRALQEIDPHWSRVFNLIPSDRALRARALRVARAGALVEPRG